VRYSFHGKVRATGQQVDGFVEASSSTEAIDRLADQGIIGVYTVRPEAKRPRNAIVLSGQEWIEEEEPAEAPAVAAPPAPVAPAAPMVAKVPRPAAAATAAAADDATANPAVLQQLVDQIQVLSAQVEKLLSRPAQVVYQSGPARGDGGGKKKSARIFDDSQNSTLRDIFQNNLDLRRSLEKLATTSGPASGPTAVKPADGSSRENAGSRDIGPREMPKANAKPAINGREHPMQAQPAA
jgi:hypothetical protein